MADPNSGGIRQHKRMAMGEKVTGMKKGGKVEHKESKGHKKPVKKARGGKC